MAKSDILVIGSKGHKLANCVDWTDKIPYLGDYLSVILNLSTLTEVALGVISSKKHYVLEKMRDEINEIIWEKARIICIANKHIYFYNSKQGRSFSNYDWCPIKLSLRNEKGEKFNKKKEGYLSYVDSWSFFLDWDLDKKEILSHYKQQTNRNYALPEMFNLLGNLANKPVAFRLRTLEYNLDYHKRATDIVTSNGIVFFPPTTKVSIEEGINFLTREISGYEEKEINLPPYVEKIKLKKEILLENNIESYNSTIVEASEKLESEKKELNRIIKFKGLLTEDGEKLEELVEEAISLFGIKLEKVDGKKEDRIFRFQDDVIPIEIKGKTASIPERDGLNQLIGRLKYDTPKNFKTHGVLIGNHYKNTPLDESLNGRKRAFEQSVIDKAKIFNCGLISTLEIFKFVDRKLSGEDIEKEVIDRLFNTIGLD